MSDTPAQPDPPKTPARKKRHWVLRVAAALIILLFALALIVQIVLWTDLPRGMVVSRIERELGLRVTAASLSTGWLGYTQLDDVTLALPLAEKAFLDVKSMKIKHTSLIGLMLGRAVSVKYIELDQPHLSVYQGHGGRWNMQEVAELLGRAGGKQSGTESAQTTSLPQMPALRITGGVISVIDNHNRQATIEPLEVNGYADTPVSWKYDIQIRPRVGLTGRLVPGGDWGQELTGKLQDLGAWAAPWVPDFPTTDIDFTWRGAVNNGSVNGRLDLQKLAVGRAQASGSVNIGDAGGSLTLRPVNLLIQTGERVLPEFALASGLLQYDGKDKPLRAEQLMLVAFGGPAVVNASYDLNAGSGQLAAVWHNLTLPGDGIKHSGSLDVTLAHPFPNSPFAGAIRVDALLASTGTTPAGPWDGKVNFHAAGGGWTNFDWNADAPTLQWRRHGSVIALNGLKAAGGLHPVGGDPAAAFHPLLVTLASIGLPADSRLAGNGSFLFDPKKDALEPWRLFLQGEHWPFHPIEGTELAFSFDANGDNKIVHLNNFILKSPDAQFSANGTYTYGIPRPVAVNITITNAPPAQAPAALAASPQRQILRGDIQGHLSLAGTLSPWKLDLRGDLSGRELDIVQYHLGDIDIHLAESSKIDDTGVAIRTQTLNLLGGRWDLDATYGFESDTLGVSVRVGDLSLEKVAGVVGRQDVAGTMDGAINLFVPGLQLDRNRIVVPPSTFNFRNVAIAGRPTLDVAQATLALDQGRLTVDPIKIGRGDGRGQLRFAMDLNNPRHIETGATVAAWPFDAPGGGRADVWAGIPQLIIDLPDKNSPDPANRKVRATARQIDLRATAALKQGRLAEMNAHAGIDGRVLDVRSIHADLLGGRMDGFARADFDELTKATAEATWENLDFAKLAVLFPGLKDLGGEMNGHARLAPATVPRPREPLALLISSTTKNGHWRTVPLGDMRFAAYLGPNIEDPGGGWRMVMDDTPTDPSFLHAANGTVHIWGRFGAHAGGTFSSQAQLSFADLDLNALVKAMDPGARPIDGRLSGDLMLLRANRAKLAPVHLATEKMFPAPPAVAVPAATGPSPDDSPLRLLIEPLYGEGRVSITRANLANFPVLAFLYNLMHVFQNVNVPEGTGNLQLHLEGGTLTINNMHYFNRGTEVRAVATIGEIWKIPDSPISGTAAGSARPLRNIKLPLLADFDTILATLTRDLTGVRFSGTLRHPITVGPIGFTDFGADLNRMLVGDVSSEVKGGAGG
ncbi:MAG TPA: hypothetical protein VG269_01965 [Tepidisphaeraceae bacterium]|jgi:hypothetical protein|nr:hypothetical protein [Tepidisphaeraceae bacterium]